MLKYLLFFSISFFSILQLKAQNLSLERQSYPKGVFREPLDLAPQASGSFGELRPNHFHSGTDYRTNQKEGYPVYAVADGYISRIRVQIGGGGHALYVDHPNGYTSVYMHLSRYNDKIAAFKTKKQYAEKEFAVDFILDKGLIEVKKGDVIAYSGNTGGSAGPHLHFELRNTKTEHPINAQLFGLTIPDRIPPTLTGLTLYNLDDGIFDEHTPRQHFILNGNNGHYGLNTSAPIAVNGAFGLGVTAVDQSSVSPNKNGIYSIELLLDGVPVFNSVFESFSFEESRAINSYIDYPYYILKSRRIQKSFIEPGNRLEIYRHVVNDGIIKLKDQEVHQVLYRVKDVMGNTSTLAFAVKENPTLSIDRSRPKATQIFKYKDENNFKTAEIDLVLPKGSLYSDLHFVYTKGNQPTKGYSAIHHVHNRMMPLHKAYTLAIKADDMLSADLKDKALIVDTRGNSHGGRFDNGFVKTTTSSFGSFYITVDTIAPTIRSLTLAPGKNLAGVKRMSFKITDNLSGIKSFHGYLNDKWVLMEYDAKTASLWHTFEADLPKGKHHFHLIVKDMKDNEQTFQAEFVR